MSQGIFARNKGFSLLELMLAGAVFTLFAWGVIEVLFAGLATDRLAEETTIATGYATEGIEAVRQVRARQFDDVIVTDATGMVRDNGEWKFSGSKDTFEKYTRVIQIAEVNRDGDGDIDEGGGSADADTRKAIVTVTWNVTPSRRDSVVLETYLTRFK